LRPRLLLSVRNAYGPWQAGSSVRLKAGLRRIANFGNPGEFDWAGYNGRRGLFVSAFLWDDKDVVFAPAGAGRQGFVEGLRQRSVNAALGSLRVTPGPPACRGLSTAGAGLCWLPW
jgi:hypothetical protein